MTLPTPTSAADNPLKLGGFATLTEGLEYAARGETGYNFFGVRGELNAALPYRDVRDQALALAAKLAGLGLERHSRVALIAETIPDFPVFFYACQYAGLLPVTLPWPFNLGGKEAYVHHLRQMVQVSGARAAVSSADLAGLVGEAVAGMDMALTGTRADFEALPENGPVTPLAADEPGYIQYSSGSTSLPKGVLITQRSITANADGSIRHGLQVRAGDRCSNWLPLYHDMGLVGFCLTPMLCQLSVDYLATPDFARRPLQWLRLMTEHGGTLAFSPSFGFDLCVRRARSKSSELEALDLSAWRAAGIGGDMVRHEVLEEFSETFAPVGFRKSAFVPSYGMAEATLAVTFAPLEEDYRTDAIDLDALADEGRAVPAKAGAPYARDFVLCGPALPEHAISVRDEADKECAERIVGRILISGPSVADGYFENDEATAEQWRGDGWLDTGDLGYWLDGQIVITGRSKDLIICNGRNIWPQDIEWAVEQTEGLRSGDVAAFSVDEGASELPVVLVQCRLRDETERERLRKDVGAAVRGVAGVDAQVVLVPHRSLPVTSSGKLSRQGARRRYLAGDFADGAPSGQRRVSRRELGAGQLAE